MSSLETLDDLFKPGSSNLKRKLNTPQPPNQTYKSIKVEYARTPNGKTKSLLKQTKGVSESNSTTPIDSENYEREILDDDEGRFFGGGVTERENQILDFIDSQTSAEVLPERIDSSWLRKQALKFEKKVTRNAELRVKFEDEPQKFMESEVDLHSEIKVFSVLSEHPELYGEIVKLGCINSLINLLTHENTDIVIDALEIIGELIDENVEAGQLQWNELVNAMIEADLLSLLRSSFARFDENNESEKNGIYHLLNILENLLSMTSILEKIGNDEIILNWLLNRVQKRESPVSQNKQYAAEVLAILLQSSTQNAKRFCEMDGVNLFLELLAGYRRRDPLKGTEEEEYLENLFDALTSVVNISEGKAKFVEAEGVELCLIMIKEGKMSKPRALRLLDHSLSSFDSLEACERLVEAGGLKIIFSMFMRKQDGSNTEHLLGIFYSLLRLLTVNSAYRIRTLAKFVEKDYEKIKKIIKLRRNYSSRLTQVEQDINREQETLGEDSKNKYSDDWLSKRLDGGLFCLQSIDVILAWLVAEDDGACKVVKEFLAEDNQNLTLLSSTLIEQINSINDDTDEEKLTKDMLKTLVKFLE